MPLVPQLHIPHFPSCLLPRTGQRRGVPVSALQYLLKVEHSGAVATSSLLTPSSKHHVT